MQSCSFARNDTSPSSKYMRAHPRPLLLLMVLLMVLLMALLMALLQVHTAQDHRQCAAADAA